MHSILCSPASVLRNRLVRGTIFSRVTESHTELWEDMYSTDVRQHYIGLPYLEFDVIDTHLRHRNRKHEKILAQQIGGSFTDLLFQNPDEPNYTDHGDMDFWFQEPEGGWRQGIARYYFLREVAQENYEWPKMSKVYDGTLRKGMKDFDEGDTVQGICNSIHLHHGICIDFGCTCLGLLHIDEKLWRKIYSEHSYEKYEEIRPDLDKLMPGRKLKVFTCKIRRKLNSRYFRWPVELEVIEPSWLTNYVVGICENEPRLLVVAESISAITGRKYARISGRSYLPPRRYAHRPEEASENYAWLQAQLDYFPADHSQYFVHHDASSVVKTIERRRALLGKIQSGNLLPDDDDIM